MGWWRCLGGLKRRIRKVPSESNVKSYGAGKALSLRGCNNAVVNVYQGRVYFGEGGGGWSSWPVQRMGQMGSPVQRMGGTGPPDQMGEGPHQESEEGGEVAGRTRWGGGDV